MTIEPSVEVCEHGPYRVAGNVAVRDAEGNLVRQGGIWSLCRCGGSRNKPFCDATHGLKGFDGAESADHGLMVDRRDTYPAGVVTAHDDRSRCAHFGQCTDRLPAVFRAAEEPFVDALAGPAEEVAPVVSSSPSGALTFSRGESGTTTVEDHQAPSITPIIDGPYRVPGRCRCGRRRRPGI